MLALHALLPLALLAGPSTDLFVDQNAADCGAANGSQALPFCTIMEAVAAAASGDSVRVAPGVYTENITLGSGVSLVSTQGAQATILDGGNAGVVVTKLLGSADTTLDGFTLTRGAGPQGGGVLSMGEFRIENCVVDSNVTTDGGAAGIHHQFGQLVLRNTTISNNSTLAPPNEIVAGGILLNNVASASIERITVSGNLTDSTALTPSGVTSFASDVVMDNSTISGNDLFGFGFFEDPGPTGGFVHTATIRSSTLANNGSGGLLVIGGNGVTLTNTIVAQNGGFSETTIAGATVGWESNLIASSAGLGPLANNGGSTLTHLPGPMSPALNQADFGSTLLVDQRGVPRLAGFADIGAVERSLGGGDANCTSAPNSTGSTGRLIMAGRPLLAANSAQLVALSLPQDSFGYFLASQMNSAPVQPPGSAGFLCLGGQIGRFVGPGEVQSSGVEGRFILPLNLQMLPSPTGFVAAQAGMTWWFQAWHRDSSGGVATSNFTESRSMVFN